jgi:hypothetical protein
VCIKTYRVMLSYILATLSVLVVFTTLWPQVQLNSYFIEAFVIYGLIAILCFIKSSIGFVLGFGVNLYYLIVYRSMGISLSQLATLPPQPMIVLSSLIFSIGISLLGLMLSAYMLFKKH